MASITLIGVGAIATVLNVTTFGAPALVGAVIGGITFTVNKVSKWNKKSKANKLNNMINEFLHSYLQCIIKDVANELSRIFEYQVLQLKETEIKKLADCAVDLMLDLKEGDEFGRNTLLTKVLQDGSAKERINLFTKNGDKWKAPDVFRKPGLRKVIVTNDGSEFTHHVKENDACDTQKYGYRGKFLEMKVYSSNTDENYMDGRHHFVDSSIDSQYSSPRSEDAAYRPVHVLVRCPKVLDDFSAYQPQTGILKLSLANFLRKKFKCFSEKHVVCPVYRPRLPTDIPNLENSDLSDSDFSYSDFTNSSLKSCNFTNCVMFFANLRNVNMSGSTFNETLICYSDLVNVNARFCDWIKTSILCSCVDYIDVRGRNYSGIIWGKTCTRHVRFGNNIVVGKYGQTLLFACLYCTMLKQN